jgi:hypothetical protein
MTGNVYLTPVIIHRNEKLMHSMQKLGAHCSITVHTNMLAGVFDRMTGGRYKLEPAEYGGKPYYTATLKKDRGNYQITYFLEDDGEER